MRIVRACVRVTSQSPSYHVVASQQVVQENDHRPPVSSAGVARGQQLWRHRADEKIRSECNVQNRTDEHGRHQSEMARG